MAYGNGANGASHDWPHSTAIAEMPIGDNGHTVQISPERLQKIRELLSEPFDPGEIKWRVTATSTHQSSTTPGRPST